MNYVHCRNCGADAVEDLTSWCGDYACCSPSHTLECGCGASELCFGECQEEHRARYLGAVRFSREA